MTIDLRTLPKEMRDKIELRESTDMTFGRFCDEDYSDIFYNLLQERADPNVEHSFIASIIGEQGCFAAGTWVETKKGPMRIEDIRNGDVVWTRSGWKKAIPIHAGKKQICEVVLKNGKIFRMTEDHKMLTQRGFVECKDLSNKDVFVKSPVIVNNIIKNDEYWDGFLFGAIAADGHVSNKVYIYGAKKPSFVKFTKSEKRLLFVVKSLLIKKGASVSVCNSSKISPKSRTLQLRNRLVWEWFVRRGMPVGKKSAVVDIPDWIFASENSMCGFLSAYYMCDGTKHDGMRGTEFVSICSVSEVLIRKMQWWLVSRGVSARVNKSNKRNNGQNNAWYVSISGWDELKRFDKLVDVFGKKRLVFRKKPKSHYIDRDNKRIARGDCVDNVVKRGVEDVYDLHVSSCHEYLAEGYISSNSGKSSSAITICKILDPNFSVDNIFFDYNDLIYNRHKLKQNTAVLVDEQSQSFGLDSHRVMIILASLKEQLRKKSIHFVFCSPVLYEESKSSMYIIEVMYVDYEEQIAYAALKTRDQLTLGHVKIPYPLKVYEDGTSLVSQEFMDAYQAKKDAHLEKVLGNKSMDIFEDRAEAVMKNVLFRKAEKIFKAQMGYIPNSTLVQIINKIYPEFNAGVVPLEIAGRIKLNKELSGEWQIAGKVTRRDRSDQRAGWKSR